MDEPLGREEDFTHALFFSLLYPGQITVHPTTSKRQKSATSPNEVMGHLVTVGLEVGCRASGNRHLTTGPISN